MNKVIAGEAFGHKCKNIMVPMPHGDTYAMEPSVPPVEPFVFTAPYLASLSQLMEDPCGDIIVDYGASGIGKTDGVRQFAARTKWPFYSVEGNRETSVQLDLLGRQDPATGKFIEGPLYKAMKLGGIFLLNEADALQADELISLYEIYHGIEVAASGEFVTPDPAFRVMFTFNNGGLTGLGNMRGTTGFSTALVDRFIPVTPNTLDDQDMAMMLQSKLDATTKKWKSSGVSLSASATNTATAAIPHVVAVFREIESCVEKSRAGDLSNSNGVVIEVGMSYRVLNRWLRECVRSPARNRVKAAFEVAFGHRIRRVAPDVYQAMNKVCQDIFGVQHWPDDAPTA